ncbi:unnamed protein product [Leptidea sinapis]|uniref:Uncharacterized protein n=1 Tax=Leptidea sinapis TaxID=189913 RepID=A0A5E4QZS6_9NEOP|nr:unnamed protein product [Leptidea sinapis]
MNKNSVFESSVDSASTKRSLTISTPRPNKQKAKYYSSISPIKLFEETQLSQEISREKSVDKIKTKTSSKSQSISKTKYNLRNKNTVQNAFNESSCALKEVDLVTPTSDLESEKIAHIEKKQSEKSFKTLGESVQKSASSVENWIKENEGASVLEDIAKIVLEKVNTSLIEMNHHTKLKLCRLFVDFQALLKTNSEKQEELYRNGARDMMKEFTQMCDRKFSEINEECKKLDENARSNFKEEALKLVHDDFDRKLKFKNMLQQDLENEVNRYLKKPRID